MTQLWLLEDLEPFPDRPEPGELFTPTTFWVDTRTAILDNQLLPAAVCSHVPAVISRASDNGHVEWVADLGDGFTTMLPGDHTAGEALLHGCLMWDRYLWLTYRTESTGQLRLVDRAGHIIQRRHLTPTPLPGWFDIHYSGPPLYTPAGDIPAEHDIRFNALTVDTKPPTSRHKIYYRRDVLSHNVFRHECRTATPIPLDSLPRRLSGSVTYSAQDRFAVGVGECDGGGRPA